LLKVQAVQEPVAQAVVPWVVTAPVNLYLVLAPSAGSVAVTVDPLVTVMLCEAPSQFTVEGLGVDPELESERVAAVAPLIMVQVIGRVTAVLRVVLPEAGPWRESPGYEAEIV